MRVDLFDFDLPESCIASRPVRPRDSARLILVCPGSPFEDWSVSDLPSLLKPDDVMVFNDTRVIPARLRGLRFRGEKKLHVEVMLDRKVSEDRWLAFIRPGRRILTGDLLHFEGRADSLPSASLLKCTVIEKQDSGKFLISFNFSGVSLDWMVREIGHIPLPPYIMSKRLVDDSDLLDYQTIYSKNEGAVAAPTAGLHFTPELFLKLDKKGVERFFITLNTGAGTFLPVRVEDTINHKMHYEWGEISQEVAESLNAARQQGRRIVAVGTTSLRLLESASLPDGTIRPWCGETNIFITPGYKFKTADVLITNFHLPRSTLFMLVSSFSGFNLMHEAYRHAISAGYRFYSYGDACLLFRDKSIAG